MSGSWVLFISLDQQHGSHLFASVQWGFEPHVYLYIARGRVKSTGRAGTGAPYRRKPKRGIRIRNRAGPPVDTRGTGLIVHVSLRSHEAPGAVFLVAQTRGGANRETG